MKTLKSMNVEIAPGVTMQEAFTHVISLSEEYGIDVIFVFRNKITKIEIVVHPGEDFETCWGEWNISR